MTKKQKKNLKRIIISLCCFAVFFVLNLVLKYAFAGYFPMGLESLLPQKSIGWVLPFALYFALYVYIGHDVIKKCVINISHGQVFDENFLMVVATIGAFGLGLYRAFSGVEAEGFDEACAVLLFYQVGEWFQSYAVGKSRKSIASLMDIRPDFANVIREDKTETVSPEEVKTGEIIIVNPGEKVPLDGVITEGASTVDTKALTGESLPCDVLCGDKVISGTVNLTGTLKIQTSSEFYNSTVAKILELVENASSKKSNAESFITKFARYYTPAVVFFALFLAVVPSIITGETSVWLYRALSFLVVSCPCALVISVPLSFFAGIGAASSKGILVKGSNYLEKFNKSNIFVFDKTGTITKGNFAVTKITPEVNRDKILKYAALAEANSSHPIAKSIICAYGNTPDSDYSITNIAGAGVIATNGSTTVYCGNTKLMLDNGISYTAENEAGTVVYVAVNKNYLGSIVIQDEIKDESEQVIKGLNANGCKTVMLTGDNTKIAERVAAKTGVTEFKAELLPQDKVTVIEKMLKEKNAKDVLCFAGDGINDAPALMLSDIGIAMGGIGSDAAVEASDIVFMRDNLLGILTAKKIAAKTMRIVNQNIYFALIIKLVILILSAMGITNMWFAVFGDVGVAVLAILNAMRVNTKSK